MTINVFVPTFKVDEILAGIKVCLEKGWTGLGFKTVEFEDAWKTYTGFPNAHFVASNTVGLHLALHEFKMLEGWQDGDEVITTPLTFVSTNHAILYENLKPVFADVDESLCLDPESIATRITPRTKAVIFVGIGGNIGKYKEVVELCAKHGLKLILDAAHMAGTFMDGRHAGWEADCTVFSFQAVKNLPTADSGMICFKKAEHDKLVRELSWLGINKDTFQRFNSGSYRWRYDVPNLGYKYHGNSIQAAIGLVQLKYLEEDNSRRRRIAEIYDGLLEHIPEAIPVRHSPACISSRHLYQIRVKNRDKVLQNFYDNEIFPGVHYIDNTEYPMYAHGRGTCPKAQIASNEVITLPIHLKLTDEDCHKITEVLSVGVKIS